MHKNTKNVTWPTKQRYKLRTKTNPCHFRKCTQKYTFLLCFTLMQTWASKRERVVWGHLSGGIKVNQVQRFFLSIQDSAQNHRELPGIDFVCRSASICFSTPRGTLRTVLAKIWDLQLSLWRQGRNGGRIQSELTICQITCNARGVISLCNVSRLGQCGTYGKTRTQYHDMQFLKILYKITAFLNLFRSIWVSTSRVHYYVLYQYSSTHKSNPGVTYEFISFSTLIMVIRHSTIYLVKWSPESYFKR